MLEKETTTERTKQEKRKIFIQTLTPYLISIIAAFGVYFYFTRITPVVFVQGASMEPTYENGDILFCSTDLESIERGDILVFKEGRKKLIKRVIGVPGETISIVEGQVYINGERLLEFEYEFIEDAGILSNDKSLFIEENEYFCLGDNRNYSQDSRAFGTVSLENIIYVKKD